MQAQRVEVQIGEKLFYMESGVLAKQAAGSVVVGFEETMVLAAATAEEKPRNEKADFLPLTIEYRDRMSASGRIPGGFLKREARPSDRETLVSRLTDRSVRPMFASGYINETMVMIHPLSFDYEHETDWLALNGAATSLLISPCPFHTAVAGIKIVRVDGKLIPCPTLEQTEKADLNLLLAGTEESLTMVEGGGAEIGEDDLIAALEFGHEWIKKICAAQKELAAKIGKEKWTVVSKDYSAEAAEIEARLDDRMKAAVMTSGKFERSRAMKAFRDQIIAEIAGPDAAEERKEGLKAGWDKAQKNYIRHMILNEGIRADGRDTKTVRDITIAVDALPRTHGSALFTRGETQALVMTTLGTGGDEQMIDKLEGRVSKRFLLHYNFPSFCVGEVKRPMGPGRREIGHGALAERAIEPILPTKDDFPYTIRVVSEILESNGSSSMASVCGASLALMDAGVPIKAPVAGIAMGMVAENGKIAILSDILGLEDALGDMDFKVSGTRAGVTAVQMDIKLKGGLQVDLLRTALAQAKEGRHHILDKMAEAIDAPRAELNPYAPRITTIKVNPDRIGALIGPGGKVIKGIVAETGCQIDIQDDGSVHIYSTNGEQMKQAVDIVNSIAQEAKIGEFYVGTIKRIVDFGAFIEIFPGTEGLVHISEWADHRVERVEDEASEGDVVMVKVINVDPSGKVRLSRKEAHAEKGEAAATEETLNPNPNAPRAERSDRGDRGDRGRGPRSGGGGGDRGGRDRGGRDRGGRY
jgi:polyribonucleotide nucleotidyltransferase